MPTVLQVFSTCTCTIEVFKADGMKKHKIFKQLPVIGSPFFNSHILGKKQVDRFGAEEESSHKLALVLCCAERTEQQAQISLHTSNALDDACWWNLDDEGLQMEHVHPSAQ